MGTKKDKKVIIQSYDLTKGKIVPQLNSQPELALEVEELGPELANQVSKTVGRLTNNPAEFMYLGSDLITFEGLYKNIGQSIGREFFVCQLSCESKICGWIVLSHQLCHQIINQLLGGGKNPEPSTLDKLTESETKLLNKFCPQLVKAFGFHPRLNDIGFSRNIEGPLDFQWKNSSDHFIKFNLIGETVLHGGTFEILLSKKVLFT